MSSKVPVVNWGRARDAEAKQQIQKLDPDGKSPLTSGEVLSLPADQLADLEGLFERLRDAGMLSGTRQKHYPVEKSGNAGYPNIDDALDFGSTRSFTPDSTLVSEYNLVRPILSDPLAGPGDLTFDDAVKSAIEGATKFITITAFSFDREDIVDALLKKAREGVQVAVLADPVNDHKEGLKEKMLAKLRDAGLDNVTVAEYPVALARNKDEYDQIMHVKKLVADDGVGGLVEISGGINYGVTSPSNIDISLETRGVAALDSFREFKRRFHLATGTLPFDPAGLVPDEKSVKKAVKARLGKAKGSRIELAGTEKRQVPEPTRFKPAELRRAVESGKRITISSKQVTEPGVTTLLQKALVNGTEVRVVEEPMNAVQTALYRESRETLRKDGALPIPFDGTFVESSYHGLVLREMDKAIASGESIDIAAF
ncbi:MAG: phospholipase D-like domain-containing protein, partial [Myxococcota bacterium]